MFSQPARPGQGASSSRRRSNHLARRRGARKAGRTLVEVDPRYFRPTEVDLLVGDPTKARQRAGLASQYIVISFEALVAEMVHADLCAVRQAGASSQPPRALRMVR